MRETLQGICIQDAYATIEISHTRNMAYDRDDDLAVAATIVLSALTTRASNQ